MKELRCVICHQPIDDGIGHNAAPAREGRCCDDCNTTVVLPMRWRRAMEHKI